MKCKFEFLIVALAMLGMLILGQRTPAPAAEAECVTLDTAKQRYLAKHPKALFAELDAKDYTRSFNKTPPVSAYPAPERMFVADDPASSYVVLLGFNQGCLAMLSAQTRAIHARVLDGMGEGI